jgi:hypothetical protein
MFVKVSIKGMTSELHLGYRIGVYGRNISSISLSLGPSLSFILTTYLSF